MLKIILLTALFVSCSSYKFVKPLEKKLFSENFRNSFIGLSVIDLSNNKVLYKLNEQKLFTPASNTKLLTFLASLSYLPDTLRTIRYKLKKDSMIIWGTGDPSLLHWRLNKNDTLLSFLKQDSISIFWSRSNSRVKHYGSGWAWDDYNDYYQVESSALPIYANVLTAIKDSLDTLYFYPDYFNLKYDSLLKTSKLRVKRNLNENVFSYNLADDSIHKTVETPIILNDSLTLSFIQDSLKNRIQLDNYDDLSASDFFYGTLRDSLLKEMMTLSDNFIAEQLLLMISDQVFDTLDTKRSINYISDSLFSSFTTEKIRWVDGSGLSRYNLISPKFLTDLLNYMYQAHPFSEFKELMATNFEEGTLKKRFSETGLTVYAKTGTLSNNHNLSGYLRTKSGKMLCFSFMMNHYLKKHREMISIMDSILTDLYNFY